MARVTVKGLWKRYGDTVVLENINLDFGDHEFVTIVGASGCGKTTFLRILLGMEQPTRGKLLIDGGPVQPEPGPDRGIVFQRYSLFPHLTVLGNLILGLELRRSWLLGRLFGARRREAIVRAEGVLEKVGLTGARDKYPAQLSGGMIKRAALARALALDPRLLFLDEPTSGLDPISAAEFDELVLYLQKELRLTIVMITHDLDTIFRTCNRVGVIVNRQMEVDTLERIVDNPNPWIQAYFHGERARARLERSHGA